MRKLRLIQYNSTSHYAVYIVDNFLKEEYRKKVLEKLKELTKVDVMRKSTNVHATMTHYTELLKHDVFKDMFLQTIELLQMFFTLRASAPNAPYEYVIDEAWGMKHEKGDKTITHIHGDFFSCAYYPKVPGETIIGFPDFDRNEKILENSLYIFHGLTKHGVAKQLYDEPRYSIAFNIAQKNLQIANDNNK